MPALAHGAGADPAGLMGVVGFGGSHEWLWGRRSASYPWGLSGGGVRIEEHDA